MRAPTFFFVIAVAAAIAGGGLSAGITPEEGTVSGTIRPAEALATIEAVLDRGVVASADAHRETGEFILKGLPEGNYSIVIKPAAEGYSEKAIDNVYVTGSGRHDLGVIQLDHVKFIR